MSVRIQKPFKYKNALLKPNNIVSQVEEWFVPDALKHSTYCSHGKRALNKLKTETLFIYFFFSKKFRNRVFLTSTFSTRPR